MGVNSKDFSSL